jgi:hypothetical protein
MRTHFEDASPGMLPHRPVCAPAEREQHRVGGNGGMPDEGRFLARIEESQPDVVVRRGGREHECHLGVGEFASHRHQGGIALPVGIEYHGGRVSGEPCTSECVHLKYSHANLHGRYVSFARIGAPGYTSGNLWGGQSGPETRSIDQAATANPLNLIRLVPA